ncbi:MAG: PEP-CTERM sorting domain-containing protein [Akkermansia sp.]
MKKTLFLMSAVLLSMFSVAQATYTWTGAEDSAWNNQNNWKLDGGSTWSAAGNGPQTHDSGMWDEIVLDGDLYKGTHAPASVEFEGWNTHFTLKNGAKYTSTDFLKFGGSSQVINVDETSKFTIHLNDNRSLAEGNFIFNVKGYQGVEFDHSVPKAGGSNKLILNLDKNGSFLSSWAVSGNLPLVFSGALGYASTSAEAKLNQGQFVLGEQNDNYEVMTRLLWDVSSKDGGTLDESSSFTDLNGNALTKSANELTATDADKDKYYLYKDDNGDIKVQYVVSKNIPEPTTVTLSLLGLTALLLRRRRYA